jgi:hypothetical protein
VLTNARRYETGQVAIFFALLIPVIFGIGAVVLDVGNWYVHKRHLQTQVDAAALAPAPEFTGCFDTSAWVATDQAIEDHAVGYSGDTLRPGIVGTTPSESTNKQLEEPNDVRVVLNGDRYWEPTDGKDPATAPDGYGLDNTLDEQPDDADPPGDGNGGFCDEGYIDVKATDEDVPLLWGLIPIKPSAKSHARAKIFDESIAEGILPFAVPEIVPGSVYALFVDESKPADSAVISRARLCGTPCTSVPGADPTDLAVYQGSNTAQPIGFSDGLHDVSVIILTSRSDIASPDVASNSITTICTQTGVKCYGSGSPTGGLALIHGYDTGSGPKPIVRQVDLGGCDSAPNQWTYFNLTGDCLVSVTAEIDTSGLVNPQTRTHLNASCSGGGTDMTLSGTTWTSFETLPEPDNTPGKLGQVPISISWKAAGSGGWSCLGMVARPYTRNAKSGPVYYLKLTATGSDLNPIPNAYSTPEEPTKQPITYNVTVGLQPPLRTQTLSDKAVVIRFASEDDPSLTQSIDCDEDSFQYPAPYDSLPKDAAEIAYGCVTPYKENPTGDCSAYSLGDLPPDYETTTFDNAPNCAQSKNGQVSSLRKGLVARLNEPTCAPNNWPDPPITPDKVTELVTNFGDDPRLVTLVVTEFQAFSGGGATIIPIRYFAGFYITGKDVSAQSPRCPGEDLHPIYGDTYSTAKKQKLDDGDVWGYFVTRVEYGSSGMGEGDCDFTGLPQNCVLQLVK